MWFGASAAAARDIVYVAIGDSITSGFNAEGIGQIGQYSWATGWGLDEPFASTLGARQRYNVALPGAWSTMIGYQTGFAHYVEANYVSIMVGANDVCWGNTGDIVANIEKQVRALAPYTHVSKIFIGGLPDLRQLYEVREKTLRCELPKVMCHPYFSGDLAYRQKIDQDIIAINRDLWRLTIEYSKVVFVDLANDTYQASDISPVDCFHPSAAGQKRIAGKFSEAFLRSIDHGSEEPRFPRP